MLRLASLPRPIEPSRISAPRPSTRRAEVRDVVEAAKARVESVRADEELRAALEAELSVDRDRMAEIGRDLARVHGQLDQINAGIIGLQSHSLRQTGVAALALAVLVAIAWKVIGG